MPKKPASKKEILEEKDLKPESESEEVSPKKEAEEQEEKPSFYDENLAQKPSFYEKVLGERPPESEQNVSNERKPSNKLFFLGGFVFLLTAFITSVFWVLLLSSNKPQVLKNQAKVTAPTPTTKPKPAIDREVWSFEVLNGSGVSGAAAKASDKLKERGYKVDKVGNADQTDETQVFISKEKSDEEVQLLLDDLKSDFGELKVTGELKDSDSSVRIVLGSEK